jgi:hypothetical protein
MHSERDLPPLLPFDLGTRNSALLLARTVPPFGEGFYCTKEHKAEPEVHDHPEIKVWWMMPRGRWQVRHKQEIHQVPCQHGDQGLNEIHSRF